MGKTNQSHLRQVKVYVGDLQPPFQCYINITPVQYQKSLENLYLMLATPAIELKIVMMIDFSHWYNEDEGALFDHAFSLSNPKAAQQAFDLVVEEQRLRMKAKLDRRNQTPHVAEKRELLAKYIDALQHRASMTVDFTTKEPRATCSLASSLARRLANSGITLSSGQLQLTCDEFDPRRGVLR